MEAAANAPAMLTAPGVEVNDLSLAEAALEWARHGWPVFPLSPRTKVPYAKGLFCGRQDEHECGFQCASVDVDQIKAFWLLRPMSNIGVTHPSALVIDEDKLGALTKQSVSLPKCPYAITGRRDGGRHFFLRAPAGWPDAAVKVKSKLDDIDVKGFGRGYVVAAPSVHESGTKYVMKLGGFMPEAAMSLIAALTETQRDAPASRALMTMADYEQGGYQLPPTGYAGSRYDAIRDFAASRYNKLGGIKAEDEVRASVHAIVAPRFANQLTPAEVDERFDRVWRGIEQSLGPPQTHLQTVADVPTANVGASAFPDEPDVSFMGGVAGMAIENLAQQTSASKVGMMFTLLSAWGGLHGTVMELYEEQSSNLFGVLVGETARGRKGTATRSVWNGLSRALQPVGGLINIPIDHSRIDGLASGQALIRHLSDAKGGTPSALVGAFAIEEEFETVLRGARSSKDYGSTLGTTINKAFDASMLSHMTVAKTIRVYAPYSVGILGNTTVEMLRSLMGAEGRAGGFANRILWLPVRERPDVVLNGLQGFDPTVAEALGDARDWWAAGHRVLTLSPEGRELVDEYYAFLREIEGPQRLFVPRLHVIAARLGMVHAALEQSAVVDQEHIERGIALTEYARSGLLWCFSDELGDEDVDYVVAVISQAGPEGMSGREVDAAFGKGRRPRLMKALKTAIGHGLIELRVMPVGPSGGRPPHGYFSKALIGNHRFISGLPVRGRSGGPSIYSPALPITQKEGHSPEHTHLRTNLGYTTEEPLINVVQTTDEAHVECHFPTEHSTSWVTTPEGGWVCSICAKEVAS